MEASISSKSASLNPSASASIGIADNSRWAKIIVGNAVTHTAIPEISNHAVRCYFAVTSVSRRRQERCLIFQSHEPIRLNIKYRA